MEKRPNSKCYYCRNGLFPLQYWPGWGWFHFNSDGGPDLRCEDEEVQKRPNPENEEEE